MAYLSFSPLDGDARAATADDAGRFSSIELRVIDFAERIDATREIAPEGRLGRFVEWALGVRLGRPLADPRLESLRRFASLVRHHVEAVVPDDIERFIASGFSQGQAHGLLAYLGGRARSAAH